MRRPLNNAGPGRIEAARQAAEDQARDRLPFRDHAFDPSGIEPSAISRKGNGSMVGNKDRTSGEAQEQLLTPSEVAELFRVDPKTVTRWAVSGRMGSIRTPGGHRRYRQSEVHQLLAELSQPAKEHEGGIA